MKRITNEGEDPLLHGAYPSLTPAEAERLQEAHGALYGLSRLQLLHLVHDLLPLLAHEPSPAARGRAGALGIAVTKRLTQEGHGGATELLLIASVLLQRTIALHAAERAEAEEEPSHG